MVGRGFVPCAAPDMHWFNFSLQLTLYGKYHMASI